MFFYLFFFDIHLLNVWFCVTFLCDTLSIVTLHILWHFYLLYWLWLYIYCDVPSNINLILQYFFHVFILFVLWPFIFCDISFYVTFHLLWHILFVLYDKSSLLKFHCLRHFIFCYVSSLMTFYLVWFVTFGYVPLLGP